jgi:hypothetical protein
MPPPLPRQSKVSISRDLDPSLCARQKYPIQIPKKTLFREDILPPPLPSE